MATPANRVPVRIARGTKANLDAAIAAGDLKEGEVCYATDENGLYVVEGGVLTQAGADLSTASIDALSDVDTTTAAPTDGQILTWVDANSNWEPADAATAPVDSVNGQTGAVLLDLDDLEDVLDNLDASATWTDGVTFAEANTLDAPGEWGYWGTDCRLYKLDDNGVDRTPQLSALKTGHTFSWSFNGGSSTGTSTMTADAEDELGDGSVWFLQTDTSIGTFGSDLTLTLDPQGPTDGQILTWVDANGQWEPADATGGGATTLDGLTDVTAIGNYVYDGNVNFASQQGGVYFNYGVAVIEFRDTDDVGFVVTDETMPQVDTVVEVSADGGSTWISSVTVTAVTGVPSSNNRCKFSHDGPADWPNGIGGLDGTITGNNQDIWLRWSQAPADGKVLTWVAANSNWEPADASVGGITNLDDVDTSTAAPTSGQVLAWNSTDSEWQPANPDPMTTDGDMIYRTSGASTRLAKGSPGQLLAVVNDVPTWQSTTINDLSDVATTDPGDPDFASVSLLLDGTDFVDKSSNALTVTNRNSATTLDTSVYQFSPSSYNFNNDVIEVANDSVLDLSTGDWTIEFFAYTGLSIGTSTYFFSLGDTSDTGACWAIRWINGIQLQYRPAGTTTTTSKTSNFTNWTTGTWHHIAVSRSGDNVYMFYDGTDVTPGGAIDLGAGFATDAPSSSLWVGARKSLGSVSGDTSTLNMEQFRITKGVARYTTAFTVPTEAYPQTLPVSASDGQVLTWVDANSKWEPTSIAKVSAALPIFADNTAAAALADGDLYRDSNGIVRVKFT